MKNISTDTMFRSVRYRATTGLICAAIIMFTACSKSAPVTQQWLAVHGHDTASWAHAQFCKPGDSLGMETINLVFTGGADENKFSLKEGSIYFPPNGRVLLHDSTFDRTYYKLIKRLQ